MKLRHRILLLGLAALLLGGCSARSQLRYPASRWLRDRDTTPIAQPEERTEYEFSDVVHYQGLYPLEYFANIPVQFGNLFYAAGAHTKLEALNVNNFDEVADSTWFTNRIGRRKLSSQEIAKGPNVGPGPQDRLPWKILSGKTSGRSAGAVIEDSSGEKYFLKFDPPANLALLTGAEMVGSKIMYAAGYNVPANYLVQIKPEFFQIAPDATFKGDGKKRPYTQADLDDMLNRVPQTEQGWYRGVASKLIDGKILGPFRLRGRRSGDDNDRFPHQHRRELRGYRIFSAFLNNTDTKEANTLDTFITKGSNKQGYIRHYFLDFSNSLGSGGNSPKVKEHQHEYRFNPKKVMASLVSVGIYTPNWEKFPDPIDPSVGVFTSQYFDPEKWRPTYPHPAFMNMTNRDAFWATKILMKLSNEDIAAIVREAQYPNPAVEAYVTQTLIERRDIVGRYWFGMMTPLDDFYLASQSPDLRIGFTDLAIASGLKPAGSATYRYYIRDTEYAWKIPGGNQFTIPSAVLASLPADEIIPLQVDAYYDGDKDWKAGLVLFLKKQGGGVELLGLKRSF